MTEVKNLQETAVTKGALIKDEKLRSNKSDIRWKVASISDNIILTTTT